MRCPSAETLHDLVTGELADSARMEVLTHVRGCAACKSEVRELLLVYSALHAETVDTVCPTDEALDAYGAGGLSAGETSRIRLHLEECARCQGYIELAEVPATAFGRVNEGEPRLREPGYALEIGRAAAADALAALMPEGGSLFGLLWGRVLSLVEDVRAGRREQTTVRAKQGGIAGALGFTGAPDPETMSAAIIMATALTLAYQLEEHQIPAEPAAVRTAVGEASSQFGAGKELIARLSDTLSTLLLR